MKFTYNAENATENLIDTLTATGEYAEDLVTFLRNDYPISQFTSEKRNAIYEGVRALQTLCHEYRDEYFSRINQESK